MLFEWVLIASGYSQEDDLMMWLRGETELLTSVVGCVCVSKPSSSFPPKRQSNSGHLPHGQVLQKHWFTKQIPRCIAAGSSASGPL